MKTITFLMLIINLNVFSQLCGGGSSQGTISPTSTVQTTSTVSSGRPYWTFNAVAGCQYTFETCGLSTVDTELEILTFPSFVAVIYNDDACGFQSRIVWTASVSGDYVIYLTRFGFFGSCYAINGSVRIRYSSNCGSALPVSLISFTGENINERNVLNWITESEYNNDYFTIERSIDGVYFENIGTVKALNTGTMYEFVDEAFQDTVNYYRLSQTDFNGEPRVVGDLVAIDNRSTKVLIGVFDLSGRKVDLNFSGVRVLLFSDGSRKVIGGE